MSVHLFDGPIRGTPPEPRLLEAVTVRLMEDSERKRFDEELATEHYLKNAQAVGRVLRYVAEYRGQWVALLVFSSAASHCAECQLTQGNGAEFLLFLKANQPLARAKAEQPLLQLARDHWSIENGQHYRQDRTQDEDRCPVRDTTAARNLSLFRSWAIFLFKSQSQGKGGKKSLPDFERHVHRKPGGLIRRFTQRRSEE